MLAALAVPVTAQERDPTINANGIVNAASFLPPTLPGGAIAQGSIFSIFGENLGPKGLEARELPLQTTLGGVEVEVVASDGRTFNALPVYVGTTQVNAVLPSDVPVGQHRLRVIRDGIRGGARTFKAVRSSPGIFTIPREGLSRFAAAQRNGPDGPRLMTRFRPARPGDIVTIWATGLGPAPSDQPPGQNVASTIEVWVGGRKAEVLHQGRSSCCVGLDQVNVRITAGSYGCRVPLRLTMGGVSSNDATLAISEAGPCGLEETVPSRVLINRVVDGELTRDSATALFGETVAQLDPTALPPRGSCLSHVPFGSIVGGSFLESPEGVEVVRIAGPVRQFSLERGQFHTLSSPPADPFVGPGLYSLDASGGPYVDFAAMVEAPPALSWGPAPELIRETGATIEWTGGADDEDVVIWTRPNGNLIDLVCRGSVRNGRFQIPPSAMANLAEGPRAISLGSFVQAPLMFPTDGPETGLLVVTQETWLQVEADRPRLPSSPITLPDGATIHAELATSFAEIQRGLMFRTVLASDRGMLFFFARPAIHNFWMYRTLIPLDIIWLNADREIVFINADTPPCPPEVGRNCPTYGPRAPSQFVLELAAGEAARRGLELGDLLDW